jgi:hypothetical protein
MTCRVRRDRWRVDRCCETVCRNLETPSVPKASIKTRIMAPKNLYGVSRVQVGKYKFKQG